MGETTHTLAALLGPGLPESEERCAELWQDLVRYLRWQNHPCPEDGAQEALSRGLAKARAAAGNGPDVDLRQYFFSFAWCVAREGWRPRREEPLGEEWSRNLCTQPNIEAKIFLDELMCQIEPGERELLMRYHLEDREDLSRGLGIPLSTIRVQVHRICRKLTRIAAAKGGRHP